MKLFVQESRKTPDRRNGRVASRMRECISLALIREKFHIPFKKHGTITSMTPPCQITVTHVNLSPDLRHATIYFTVLDSAKKEEALNFFSTHEHYFKNVLATQMRLRFIPALLFKIDDSFDISRKIDELLNG
ncbi:MAG: 30S ribosome-binding factor RbfA [Holosporales bacterium]|nr:30S ribosome-binding factor RbfA [Holosporales bacterium]